MQLIGMLDSPYVRRVAVSLLLLELPFEHRSVSVFRAFDRFQVINPVVKAPTLVCDEGTVLMDSTLILDYAEALAAPRTLMPRMLAERRSCLRIVGLALAACDKSVQIIYERNLRPPERQHEPWVARVTGQLIAAARELEGEIAKRPAPSDDVRLGAAEVAAAVAWHFTQCMLPEALRASEHPALQALSVWAERQPVFAAAPHGSGTVQSTLNSQL
jgi:glutathione S-transferase